MASCIFVTPSSRRSAAPSRLGASDLVIDAFPCTRALPSLLGDCDREVGPMSGAEKADRDVRELFWNCLLARPELARVAPSGEDEVDEG